MLKILLFSFLTFSLFAQTERESHQVLIQSTQRDDHLEHKKWWDGPHLTGDWTQTSKLAQNGITLAATYTTDIAGNPLGGKARGFAYAGSYGLSANIDLTKAGLTGFGIFSSAVWRTGTSLSRNKIDNQFPVQQVFGSQTVKLNELFLIQSLFDHNLVIKAGRLDGGNDFFTSPLYWKFVNNGFDGNPISIFFNVPFTAYPNSTWGAFLLVKPYKRLSIKTAVYNANSNIQKNKYHGMNFTFQSTNGVIWITEWCALINQEKEDRGMPGNYKAGFFYLTGSEPKFSGGSQKGDPCLYFLFDQMIYRPDNNDPTRGLIPFVSLLFQPKNRNLFPFFFDGGFVFKGPLASRPKDSISLGLVYGSYSSDKAKEDRRKGKLPQSFEAIIEFNYWVQINPWFYIAPDVQYIIHPKGTNTPNAFVLAAQIGIDIW